MVRTKQFGLAVLGWLALFLAGGTQLKAQEDTALTGRVRPKSDINEVLLAQIWDGVQAAQIKYRSGCGSIFEVRSSKLLLHPLHFRGKFCASGTEKFSLEYFEPERIHLVFNRDYLNVTTGKEKRTTEVLAVGSNVARTQKYLSGKDSIKNLKDQFLITIKESSVAYSMTFVPRSQRFKQKINYVIVTLRKSDFLLSTLEVDGKNGVNSIFTIEVENTNQETGEDLYKIYRP
jgi:hypothetical protein